VGIGDVFVMWHMSCSLRARATAMRPLYDSLTVLPPFCKTYKSLLPFGRAGISRRSCGLTQLLVTTGAGFPCHSSCIYLANHSLVVPCKSSFKNGKKERMKKERTLNLCCTSLPAVHMQPSLRSGWWHRPRPRHGANVPWLILGRKASHQLLERCINAMCIPVV
jgi:hypothetical protein